MRVIVKHPGMEPEVIEVESIQAINKLVGNVDEDGNGWDHVGSDERQEIGSGIDGVDIYCRFNAAFNIELKENLWFNDNHLLCGTVVFAGYDNKNKKTNYGACSLTDEQIENCLTYIGRQKA